jgi:hypothetical protein
MTLKEFVFKVEKLSPRNGDVIVAHHAQDVPSAQVQVMLDILKGMSAAFECDDRRIDWLLLPSGLSVECVDPESMRRLGWVREEEMKRLVEAARKDGYNMALVDADADPPVLAEKQIQHAFKKMDAVQTTAWGVRIPPTHLIEFVSQSQPNYAPLYRAKEAVFLEDALVEAVEVARQCGRAIVLDFGHTMIVVCPESDPMALFEKHRAKPEPLDYAANGKDGFDPVEGSFGAPAAVPNPCDWKCPGCGVDPGVMHEADCKSMAAVKELQKMALAYEPLTQPVSVANPFDRDRQADVSERHALDLSTDR